MAINKAVGLVSALALMGGIVACSSTDNGTTTTPDAGTVKPDSGSVKPDAGPAVDSGAALVCLPPADLTGYTEPNVNYGPPATWGKGVCSATQISDVLQSCLGQADAATNTTACAAWKALPANAACAACAITNIDANGTGPLLVESTAPSTVVAINDIGCFSHYQAGCGPALAKFGSCLAYSCDDATGGNCETSSADDISACRTSARTTPCKAQGTAFNTSCNIALGADSKAEPCFQVAADAKTGTTAETQVQYFTRLAGYYCGAGLPTSSDAGDGG